MTIEDNSFYEDHIDEGLQSASPDDESQPLIGTPALCEIKIDGKVIKSEIASLSKKSSSVKHKFDAALAKSVFGKKIVENDLTIIEGIGPKIAELFQKAGIGTWKDLSETTVERCQQVLEDEGEQFKVHKPTSWPLQSEMAYSGKWEELKKWQDDMLGGKL